MRDIDVEFYQKLNEFLTSNYVQDIPSSNLEKLNILRQIIYNEKVNVDCLEIAYEKNKGTANAIPTDEFLNLTHRIEINTQNASYFAANLRMIVKEEKRTLRFKKVKEFFKKI